MKKTVLTTLLVIAFFAITAHGQQDESILKKRILESSVGTWLMSNDSISFEITLVQCPKVYGKKTVDGICGQYKCVKIIKGDKIISEGSKLSGSNAYTDYEKHANTISFYFYDEVMKKSTSASIKPIGDTLFWMIYPNIDTYTLTVFGQDLSGPVYPKGWSVPVKAVLFRVKEERKK